MTCLISWTENDDTRTAVFGAKRRYLFILYLFIFCTAELRGSGKVAAEGENMRCFIHFNVLSGLIMEAWGKTWQAGKAKDCVGWSKGEENKSRAMPL